MATTTSLPIHTHPSTDATPPTNEEPKPKPTRRPYTGSCHCGLTKYIAYLTLSPSDPSAKKPAPSAVRIMKCNCTTCQKMSFFHVRLPDAREEFILLSPIVVPSPSDPSANRADEEEKAKEKEAEGVKSAHGGIKLGPTGLLDYTCFAARIHWYFCPRCGVRCFAFSGQGEIRALDLKGEKTQVWTPKEGFWEGDMSRGSGYLTVNAATLDAGQEGLDLVGWHEEGWIVYLDYLEEKEKPRFRTPFLGGMY